MTYAGDLLDAVRIRVDEDTMPPGTLLNLLANPDAMLGVWAWRMDVGTLQRTTFGGGFNPPSVFRATIGASQTAAYSEGVAVVPGQYVGGGFARVSTTLGLYVRAAVRFYRSDGTFLSSATPSALATGAGASTTAAFLVPANAATARLVVEVSSSAGGMVTPGAGPIVQWNAAYLVTAATAPPVTAPVTRGYPGQVDVMGSSVSLGTQRRAFDQTLTAVIRDATLDPSEVALLRQGRRMVVEVQTSFGSSVWRPIWTGTVLKAVTDYGDLKRGARPTITLTGTGPGAVLAGTPCPRGVADFDGFPELMEGTRVPYRMNGSTDQIPGAFAQVSTNDQATLLDQVILTRDSCLGYAWVSAQGVLVGLENRATAYEVWEFDESHYSALSVSYDPETCINTVTVILLRHNASTGETEEVTYGPYVDAASRRDHGVQAAEFRVHGITDPAAYAAAILAANATPKRRVDSLRIPIQDDSDQSLAFVDLYDQVRVTNADLGLDLDLRPTGIDHAMDSRGRWYMDLQFTSEDSVAAPVTTTPLGTSDARVDGVWYDPTFTNSWRSRNPVTNATDRKAQYMRKNGRTYLTGLVENGSALGTVVCTLPVGFRPSGTIQLTCMASGNVVARVQVAGNGQVTVVSGSTAWTSWESDFAAEQ